MNTFTNQKVEDSTAPLDFIKPNGYYTVGDKNFNYKLSAMMYATQTRQDITWVFNNIEFESVDWRTRLDVDIRHLYRARAQQLRDKYDYLIVTWSGGADSTTVLNSFLDNNIKLDEVVIYWPFSNSKGRYTPNTQDISAANMLSEWDYSIKPKLDQIKQQHPDLLITMLDICGNDTLKIRDYDDDALIINHFSSLVGTERYYLLDDLIYSRVKQHKNVATVYGVSPVDLALVDNWLGVCFSDGTLSPPHKTDYTNTGWPRHIEYFYWTPDFPEIIREQAHILLNYFNKNPLALNCLDKFTLTNRGLKMLSKKTSLDRETFRAIRKPLIYPDYNSTTFQVHKQQKIRTFVETYNWFWQIPDAVKFVDPWRSAVKSYHSIVDRRFFRDDDPYEYRSNGITPFLIGKISDQAFEQFKNVNTMTL